MSDISVPDRRKVICEIFCQAYFGQVCLEQAMWHELERHIDTYFAAIERNKSGRNNTSTESYAGSFTKLAKDRICIIRTHPLSIFPVSLIHKQTVTEWLLNFLTKKNSNDTLDASILCELATLRVCNSDGLAVEDDNPEYIFKTFDRGECELSSTDRCYVTLLEENRPWIGQNGHGTTGLTSWQGAIFLADWCQTQLDKFQVRLKKLRIAKYNKCVNVAISIIGKTYSRVGRWGRNARDNYS